MTPPPYVHTTHKFPFCCPLLPVICEEQARRHVRDGGAFKEQAAREIGR
ncbi:hypothetical protein PVAP13_8KG133901 [Panicum virgatum]|nr:hypothetical protein PVAP13_8KG133901 [Panicum virgatum]